MYYVWNIPGWNLDADISPSKTHSVNSYRTISTTPNEIGLRVPGLSPLLSVLTYPNFEAVV